MELVATARRRGCDAGRSAIARGAPTSSSALRPEVEAGSAGLPVGVQVAGRPCREDVVLAVMRRSSAPSEP